MREQQPPGAEWEPWVERQIRQAQEQGVFDRLPGLGSPIAEIDGRVDDEMWWLRSLARRGGLSLAPPSLEIRRTLEVRLGHLWGLPDETAVRQAVAALNEAIRAANFAITAGPSSTVLPLDVEETVVRWRDRQRDAAG